MQEKPRISVSGLSGEDTQDGYGKAGGVRMALAGTVRVLMALTSFRAGKSTLALTARTKALLVRPHEAHPNEIRIAGPLHNGVHGPIATSISHGFIRDV